MILFDVLGEHPHRAQNNHQEETHPHEPNFLNFLKRKCEDAESRAGIPASFPAFANFILNASGEGSTP